MSITEQVIDMVNKRQWEVHHKPFNCHEEYALAVKNKFHQLRLTPVKAEYDDAGNCVTCGECGRCPGWHSKQETEEAKKQKAQP